MENTTVYLFERFLEIEDKSNLFQYEIGNVKIWQYIRFTICAKMLEELSGIRTISAVPSAYGSKKSNIFSRLKRSQFLIHKKDILVICHPRRVKEDGKYRCFVTEEFISKLRKSYYVFENSLQGTHFEPAQTKNLKYIDTNFLYFCKLIKYDEKKNQKEIKLLVQYISQLMREGYKCELDSKFERDLSIYIMQSLQNIYYSRIYARIVLNIIRPKIIFLTVSYDIFNQSLIRTAKGMNIPVVELQHGRMGATHAAYNFKSSHELEIFPDYLFVYGEYERQNVRYPINRSHIFAVGYPELERKVKAYHFMQGKGSGLTIVFTPGAMEGKVISYYALEIRKCFPDINIRIIYKLHPSEYMGWENKYPELKGKNLEVIENNDHDIYYYLGQADYVIGISSTSLFEAMMFRTEILVIKELDYQKTEAVYKNKCAELVSSVDEVVDIIGNRKKVRKQYNCDFYFKRHSIKNMNEAIKKILK